MVEEKEKKETEAHVAGYKKKIVEQFVKLIKEYPIVGALNMEGMPAPQLQKMRQQLRGSVEILMNKRRLMKIAIEEAKNDKKGLEKLEPMLKGMPALLFTKENPFKLYKILDKSKSPAPAKAGQLAPKDIVVSAGPTNFVPGPVIGELGALGIKSEVKDGKISIKEDSVVVKEGEEINAILAGMLTRLGIEPMEIGLDLVAVYEDGIIYGKDVLAVDEVEFANNIDNAARWALNLAVDVGYYTPETVGVLIPKAFREAKEVALEGNIMCDLLAEELVEKAERQMNSLKSEAKIEDVTETKVDEKKVEEKPVEAPKVEEKAAEVPKVEEKKEEPKPEAPKEEVKVEEKPKEQPTETPKVEEPNVEEKKEPKPEEKPAETPKEEPKPEVKEEPKIEEKPVEAPKPEVKVEEEKKEPVKEEIKIEEAHDIDETQEKPKEKVVEEKKEEIKEEIKEIKKEIKEQKEDPIPKEVEKIEKEVEKVEEEQEEVDEMEKEVDIEQGKAEVKVIEAEPEPKVQIVDREISEEKKKEIEAGEKLFEELKQKGTLRESEEKKEEPKVNEPLTPEEIIKQSQEKMKEKQDDVPSTHDLLKKKQEKENKDQ